jgi:hypothetical protein
VLSFTYGEWKLARAIRIGASEHALDDRGGTSNAGFDVKGFVFAVVGAGAAFDAAVSIQHEGLFIPYLKNLTGTDLDTATAAVAFLREVFQGDHIC